MRILIADTDGTRAKGLVDRCVSGGHSADHVIHGAAALEWALEQLPELVICSLDLPVIDGARLAEILRSNPRTRDVSFLFLVKDELDAPVPMDPRDAAVVAPWDPDAVLGQVHASLERRERLGVVQADPGMQGKLSQIGAGDLLGLLQMNRKSGTLHINREGAPGSANVELRAGQVVDASVPLADGTSVVGEKAFYRVLTWKEGRFEFVPGEPPEGRIHKPMRVLILEGMGLLDEWEKRRPELPTDDTRLRLVVARERVPPDVHPRTPEVLDALESRPHVRDVVDHCPLPDLQVLRVLALLLERGCLAVEAPTSEPRASAEADERLFTPTQIRRLRDWATTQRPSAGPVIKLLLLTGDCEVLRNIVEVLPEFPDFRPVDRLVHAPADITPPAILGHFPLGSGLSLRLLALPADARCAPLWDIAARGMLGAVIVPSGPYAAGIEATHAAHTRLKELSPRPLLHLLLADSPTATLSLETLEQLGPLEGGSVFVLQVAPARERASVLRNVFGRLVQ